MKNNHTLFSIGVQSLAQLESVRASREGVKHFVEPTPGVLAKAKSKRHHIIFGRRGSGKSSLLQKISSDLTVGRMSNARDGFDAIGVVVDWIDACKQRRLDDLLDLYDATAPLNAAKAQAFEVEPRWNDTGDHGWQNRPVVLSRSTC